MIPVYQTIKHENTKAANCFQACIASFLEKNLNEVPNFILHDDWLDRFINFINNLDGYKSEGFLWGKPPNDNEYHIGYSNEEIWAHAVIMLNGEVVHDPYGGISKQYNIEGYFPIIKL